MFVPHEIDVNLIIDARAILDSKALNDREKEKMQKLIDEYQIAYKLNRGPNLARSFHWCAIARQRRNKLKIYVEGWLA